MTTSTWIRWSGLSLLLGGISLALFVLVHPQSEFNAEVMGRGVAEVAHNVHFLGASLAVFGLVGLHLRQMARAGRLGTIGFVLAFFGMVWFAGLGLMSFAALPFIATHAPDLVAKDGPYWSEFPGPLFIIGLISFVLGFIVLGVAVFRAKVLPRWSGLPVIPGALLLSLPPFAVPVPVLTAGGLLLGSGLAWMGTHSGGGPATEDSRHRDGSQGKHTQQVSLTR